MLSLLRRLICPNHSTTTTPADRQRIEDRQREVQARMERLRIEAERPALRHGWRPGEERR